MPIPQVDQVGVRYLGWIFAKILGAALNAAIESVVRAVGRMVVSVDAIELVMTMNSSSLVSVLPAMPVPKMLVPSTLSTSSALAGLVRPTPWLPAPAHACAPTVTMT